MRLAARTSRAESGLGLMQTRIRSPGGPDLRHRLVLAVDLHLFIDPFRRAPQRQFPQRHQVAPAEKALHRLFSLLRNIHFARLQALEQVVGREVDQFDLIGVLQKRIGNCFPNNRPGDLGNHVVQAFEMLHVDGGVDVDPGFQKLFNVLPALGMAQARRIGMRQLIDQDQCRVARECSIEVKLPKLCAAILHQPLRKDFQAFQQGFGFRASVRLDVARHDIDAFGVACLRGFQHGVGFADTRCRAQENFQLAAPAPGFLIQNTRQHLIGIGSFVVHVYPQSE